MTMDKEQDNKTYYIIYCVSQFAKRFGITLKQSYAYLKRHKGLEFLYECYAAEHLLSLDDAVDDLSVICQKHGGALTC